MWTLPGPRCGLWTVMNLMVPTMSSSKQNSQNESQHNLQKVLFHFGKYENKIDRTNRILDGSLEKKINHYCVEKRLSLTVVSFDEFNMQ